MLVDSKHRWLVQLRISPYQQKSFPRAFLPAWGFVQTRDGSKRARNCIYLHIYCIHYIYPRIYIQISPISKIAICMRTFYHIYIHTNCLDIILENICARDNIEKHLAFPWYLPCASHPTTSLFLTGVVWEPETLYSLPPSLPHTQCVCLSWLLWQNWRDF